MPDRRAGCDEEMRTPACGRAAHGDCPHRHGGGGGFNPRRLRLEFGDGLCQCSCHASCPVARTRRLAVAMKAWYASCTCAGAEAERQRLDDAGIKVRDFAEYREQRQRRRRAYAEAAEGTRARAAGSDRDEIRRLYLAELDARNLKVPAEPVLDAVVDHIITGNPLPAVRLLGESLRRTGKAVYDAMNDPPPGGHARSGPDVGR
jgi:hypothetical protein